MAEEREVPSLYELVAEIDTFSANLDKNYPPGTEVSGETMMSELKNSFLPLLKDVATAAMLDISDLQDEVNPVKIGRADADETVLLLKAYAASNPTDPALQSRIAEKVELLEDEGEDDEEEEDEEPETN